MRRALVILLGVAVVAVWPAEAPAAIFNAACTGSTGDVISLKNAITQANATPASADTVALGPGCLYELTAGSGQARAALSRRVLRRLRSSASGRYRTSARYSAATVRGTKWSIADRCDGTLTKVSRGQVAVRDFRRRRTILVRAGRSYLARATSPASAD